MAETDPSLFSRAFNDWELDFVERFLQNIQTITTYRDMEDRVIWSASRRENILVKSLYFILEPGDSLLFPSTTFGGRVRHLRWLSSLGRHIGGKSYLWIRFKGGGYYLANRCFLRLSKVEIVDHLLLHWVKGFFGICLFPSLGCLGFFPAW